MVKKLEFDDEYVSCPVFHTAVTDKINELVDRVNALTKIWERCHGGVYKMVEDQAIKEIQDEQKT